MHPQGQPIMPAVPDLPGICMITAMAYCEGDLGLLRELLELLRRHNAEALQTLRQLLGRGDEDAAYRVAHSLKAAAGQIGALELARSAKVLEKTIQEHPQRVPDGLVEEAEAHLKQVLHSVELLDQYLARASTAEARSATSPTPEPLAARFTELAALIDDDVGSALDLLGVLEGIIGDPALIPGLDAIRAALRTYDTTSAQRLTAELRLHLECLDERKG